MAPDPAEEEDPAASESAGSENDDSDEGEKMDAEALDPAAVREAAAAVEPLPAAPTGFVVSVTKRGKFRRLHLVEACPFVPGVHYKEYEEWGEIMPGEADVQAICTRCLPQRRTAPLPEDPDVVSDSSSSSGRGGSADESADDERPAKRPNLGGTGSGVPGPGAA